MATLFTLGQREIFLFYFVCLILSFYFYFIYLRFLELKQGLRKKEVTLQKSKSLDREKSTAARKRRRFMMSRSSLAPTSTNLLDPHLERNGKPFILLRGQVKP